MEKIMSIGLLALLLIGMVLVSGCTQSSFGMPQGQGAQDNQQNSVSNNALPAQDNQQNNAANSPPPNGPMHGNWTRGQRDANWTARNPDSNRTGMPQGRMMNLTDEQRQQMFQQMQQQAIDACTGKADKDSCAMQSQRGNRTGTCQLRNETLMCTPDRQFQRGQMPPPGAGSMPPQDTGQMPPQEQVQSDSNG